GRGVDVVYDAVGGPLLGAALDALRPHGRLVVGGYLAGEQISFNVLSVMRAERRILGANAWTRVTARHVLALLARGKLLPVIDTVVPFEQLPRGLERLLNRQVLGKVIVSDRIASGDSPAL